MAPSMDYNQEYQRANTAYVQGDYESAAEIIDRLITVEPDDANARLLRGHIYCYGLQRYEVAQDDYQAVLNLTSDPTFLEYAQTGLQDVAQGMGTADGNGTGSANADGQFADLDFDFEDSASGLGAGLSTSDTTQENSEDFGIASLDDLELGDDVDTGLSLGRMGAAGEELGSGNADLSEFQGGDLGSDLGVGLDSDLGDLGLDGDGSDDPFAAIVSDDVPEDVGGGADGDPFSKMAGGEEDSVVSSADAGFADDPFGAAGNNPGDGEGDNGGEDLLGASDGDDPFGDAGSAASMDMGGDISDLDDDLGSDFGSDLEGDLGSDFESDFGGDLDDGLGGDLDVNSENLDLGSLDLGSADLGESDGATVDEPAGDFGGFGEEALAADLAADISEELPAVDNGGRDGEAEGALGGELGFDSSWDLDEIDGPGSMQEEGELGSDAFAHPDEVDQEFLQDVSFANNAPFGDLDDSVTLGTPVLDDVSGVIASETSVAQEGGAFEGDFGEDFGGDLGSEEDAVGIGSGFATETGALELGDNEGFGSLDLGDGDLGDGDLDEGVLGEIGSLGDENASTGSVSPDQGSESVNDQTGF
ncbi:MAG: tetratricopeptide repeat protein, partial [Cyanobacteria bacterium P01_F01_bin.153]